MTTSYQTILARAADDLDQVVDDLDLAARLAPRDERMAIAARALQAHEMAIAMRGCAGVPAGADGIRGRRGVVVIGDELADVERAYTAVRKEHLASIRAISRELRDATNAAFRAAYQAKKETTEAADVALHLTQVQMRMAALLSKATEHVDQ